MAETKTLPEKIASQFFTAIKVSAVARSMMLDAERSEKGTAVFEMKSLLAAAQKEQAP
jgi:hypothetical protein